MIRSNALRTGALLGSLGTGLAFLTPGPVAHLSAAPRPVPLTLRVSSTLELPGISLASLMTEAETIWNDAFVELRWERAANAEGTTGTATTLRLVLHAGPVPATRDTASWTVGELVRTAGARPLALASITGARHVVEASLPTLMPVVAADRDRRLGVVLGRAIAHEVGHYLLETDTHAARGLMRANIPAREFADPSNRSFRLDDAAQAHLAARAALESLSR